MHFSHPSPRSSVSFFSASWMDGGNIFFVVTSTVRFDVRTRFCLLWEGKHGRRFGDEGSLKSHRCGSPLIYPPCAILRTASDLGLFGR
jgi:hypothetical protein